MLRTVAAPEPRYLRLGDRIEVSRLYQADPARPTLTTETLEAVAEGTLLTPAGPRETLLVRVLQLDDRAPLQVRGPEDGWRVSYRWLAARQGEVARITGPERSDAPYFDRASAVSVLGAWPDADQGIQIQKSLMPLTNRGIFLTQYGAPGSRLLSTLDPAWTNAGAMIGDVVTRDDPQNGGSLAETWDFTDALVAPAVNGGIDYSQFSEDVFVQVLDDLNGAGCSPNTYCSPRDISEPFADGSWQYYLKFEYWNRATATRRTRDANFINDNDTTNPSVDLTLLSTDEDQTSDWQQICFADSPGVLAKYLQFNYNSPNWAVEYDPAGSGDHWVSTGWNGWGFACLSVGNALKIRATTTTCDGSTGVAAFGKVEHCGVNAPTASYGLDFEVVEDGYVRARTGNIVPALLVRQSTAFDVRAVSGLCIDGGQQYNYDYWWFSETYGLLGRVSSTNAGDCTTTPTDWTDSGGNQSDGAYLTFGLFPPYQVGATGCLGEIQVNWSRPLGCPGANCDDRFIDGYRVYWGPTPGSQANVSALIEKIATSYTITSGLSPTTYVSVVTEYTYSDIDLGVNTTYRSPLSYGVSVSPLEPASFVVGNRLGNGSNAADYVSRLGSELFFPWEAVPGAAGYEIRRGTGPNPATHSTYVTGIGTTSYTTVDGSGGNPTSYFFEVFALDACGNLSNN